jgi:hypothetical protein
VQKAPSSEDSGQFGILSHSCVKLMQRFIVPSHLYWFDTHVKGNAGQLSFSSELSPQSSFKKHHNHMIKF